MAAFTLLKRATIVTLGTFGESIIVNTKQHRWVYKIEHCLDSERTGHFLNSDKLKPSIVGCISLKNKKINSKFQSCDRLR